MSSDVHGDIMYAKDIDERITDLLMVYHNVARELDDYEIMELEALREFRETVVRSFDREKWDAGMSFVSDTYWARYAAEHARDAYGEAVDTPYWDDERYADDLRLEGSHPYIATELEDEEYWYDGQS
jgi:hypothetical protein